MNTLQLVTTFRLLSIIYYTAVMKVQDISLMCARSGRLSVFSFDSRLLRPVNIRYLQVDKIGTS